MEHVKYGEELEANHTQVNEKYSSEDCKYRKIKAVYADSPTGSVMANWFF